MSGYNGMNGWQTFFGAGPMRGYGRTIWLGLLVGSLGLARSGFGSGLESLEAIASKASSLDAFLRDSKLIDEYRKALVTYTGGDRFRCQTFDEVLSELRAIHTKVPQFGKRLWATQSTAPVIRASEYPTSKRGPSPGTSWNLRQSPRAFHGIWVDPSQEGCVSPGKCEQADVTAPRRWAMALRGAKVFVLEKGVSFGGSAIVLLPLRGKGARWNLVVAAGSAKVRRRGYFRVGKGSIRRQTLMEVWRKKYKDPFPLTELSRLPNQPQIAHFVSLESHKSVGYLGDFTPGDPMSSLIEEASPRQCHRASLKELGWNLFAGFGGEGTGATSTGGPNFNFDSGGSVQNFLLSIDPYQPDALAAVPEESLPALQEGLGEALKSPNPKVRENAAVTINLLKKKNQPRVVANALGAAGPATPDAAKGSTQSPFTPGLRQALRDPVPPVRDAAARGLADLGDKSPDVQGALNDSIRRPGGGTGGGFPAPGGGIGGGDSSSGLSPSERARRGIDSKLRNGLPIADEDIENLLDKAARSPNPRDRKRARDTFGDLVRNPRGRDQARAGFSALCSGPNPRLSPQECRRLLDAANEPDPKDPLTCESCERARQARQARLSAEGGEQ